MTIHKAMGETIGKVVTRISFSEKQYCLWQREQLYVIVSRVRKMQDITFVGEASETLSAIRELLNKKNQWYEYCQRIVDTSANCSSVPLPGVSIFRLTSRDRPKSAPYPRLKNSKKTSKCQVLFYSTRKSKFFEKKFF